MAPLPLGYRTAMAEAQQTPCSLTALGRLRTTNGTVLVIQEPDAGQGDGFVLQKSTDDLAENRRWPIGLRHRKDHRGQVHLVRPGSVIPRKRSESPRNCGFPRDGWSPVFFRIPFGFSWLSPVPRMAVSLHWPRPKGVNHDTNS